MGPVSSQTLFTPRWLRTIRKFLRLFYHSLWGHCFGYHLLPEPVPAGEQKKAGVCSLVGAGLQGSRVPNQGCSEAETCGGTQGFGSYHL